MSFLIAAIALIHQTGTVPALPAPDKVVITANGHPILAKQLEAYLYDWMAPQVGKALAMYEIIHAEAAKDGVHLSEPDVQSAITNEIAQMMAQAGAPQGSDQAAFLKARGISKSQVEFRVRVQKLVQGIADKEFNPAMFVKVSTIIVRSKQGAGPADDATNLASVNSAYGRLTKGDDWAKVFHDTVTDADKVPNNGLLGWIDLDQFPAETRLEIGNLKVGGVTKPVKTRSGYQIFRVEQKGATASKDDVAGIKSIYQSAAPQVILKRLTDTAKIDTSY